MSGLCNPICMLQLFLLALIANVLQMTIPVLSGDGRKAHPSLLLPSDIISLT